MPQRPAPVPSGLGAAFSVREGRAAGMTPAQLRRESLRAPTRGFRATGPPPEAVDVLARCREALPWLPADAVFCGATALALLHVDLPRGVDPAGFLHVEVGPGTTPPRRPGVRGHRRSGPEVPTRLLAGGVRVLPPEVVCTRMGGELDEEELVVLGDALTRRRAPLSSVGGLEDALALLPPRARGRRRLRAALSRVRPRTDSPMETRLRLLVVRGGLPEPVVNVPVLSGAGTFVALPDLSYPASKVAIEYDGDVHRTDRTTWRRDIGRRQAMEALGWRVVTCTADDLRRPARTLTWIRAALTHGLARPHAAAADAGFSATNPASAAISTRGAGGR